MLSYLKAFISFIICGISWIKTLGFSFDPKTSELIPGTTYVDTAKAHHGLSAIQYPTHAGTFHTVTVVPKIPNPAKPEPKYGVGNQLSKPYWLRL
jgi:hypothetical protein